MKLYVPEIGDHLVLTKDWTFELHAESRNEQLAALFGHYLTGSYNGGWVDEQVLPRLRNPDYKIDYPDREDRRFRSFGRYDYAAYDKACREAQDTCPEYVQYYLDYAEWNNQSRKVMKEKLTITLPASTVLAVDRIYIRKGASDYSSITFYAKELGEVNMPGNRWSWGNQKATKRKAQRFWAKLADCNTIEFELTEK
jgi:hypothetical protein